MFILAQVLGGIGGAIGIVCQQFKHMVVILVLNLVASALCGIQFLILGGNSGAITNGIAVVQILTVFILQKNKIEPPIWLCAIFIALYITTTVIFYQSLFDLLPLLAAICAVFMFIQKNSSIYRLLVLGNILFWLIYDICLKAYGASAMHAIMLISTVVAIIRLDRKFIKRIFTRKKETE